MREEPIHEVHVIHSSEYVDNKVACKITFPTTLGIPLELWMNTNGNVVGVNYYHDEEISKQQVRCGALNCNQLFPSRKAMILHREQEHAK
jgi:hypothetical protein